MPLAPYAMEVGRSRGRRWPEPPHRYRNDYARDRDRVIHARAFRRLEAKTQVFTTRYSDHFRNRLTHTLEVAQIARTVAGALDLNADLAEALALVHDIGHPPFGHAGEHCLDGLLRPLGDRFDHNLHALRMVEEFERRYLDFPGLNLTFEVREGIVKHSRDYSAERFPELAEYALDQRPPLEAQLMDTVDEIAYNTADLDDGFEAKLVDLDLVRAELPFFAETYGEFDRRYPQGRAVLKIGASIRGMLDELASDLIEHTGAEVKASGVSSVEEVRVAPRRLAGFSPAGASRSAELKKFLNRRLYAHPALAEERDRSVTALEELFRYYMEHAEAMPPYFAQQAGAQQAGALRAEALQGGAVSAGANQAERKPRHRVVCDYIAGMTDHFLLRQHRMLLGAG